MEKHDPFAAHSESQSRSFSSRLDELDPYFEKFKFLSKGVTVFSLAMIATLRLTPTRCFVSSTTAVMKLLEIPEKNTKRTASFVVTGIGAGIGLLAAVPFTVAEFRKLGTQPHPSSIEIEDYLSEDSFQARAEKIRNWQKRNPDASDDSFNNRMIRINDWERQRQAPYPGDSSQLHSSIIKEKR